MLKLAYAAVMVWLFISACCALMPGNAVTAAGPGISGVTGVLQDMLGQSWQRLHSPDSFWSP